MAKKRQAKHRKSLSKTKKYLTISFIALFIIALILVLIIKSNNITKDNKVITYTTDIQPVISRKCISCHSVNGTLIKKPLDSYNDVIVFIKPGNAKDSPLIKAVDGGSMSRLLTQPEIELFKKWVDEGGKE